MVLWFKFSRQEKGGRTLISLMILIFLKRTSELTVIFKILLCLKGRNNCKKVSI